MLLKGRNMILRIEQMLAECKIRTLTYIISLAHDESFDILSITGVKSVTFYKYSSLKFGSERPYKKGLKP